MEAVPAPSLRSGFGARVAAGAIGLAILGVFTLYGPTGPLAIASLGVAVGIAALFVPAAWRPFTLPLLAILILFGQFAPGFEVFDAVPPLLALLAAIDLLLARRRKDWEFHLPAWTCVALLTVPLLALPWVVSLYSYLGVYKSHLLWVLLYFALRRLVPPERSRLLLWVFPTIGVLGALQLLQKTSGLGALLFARMGHRNFYTRLPWGQSDFIAAVLEFCMCMTIVLILLERRKPVRIALGFGCLLMLQGLLILFSRAGAVALFVFAAIIAIGLGGRRGLAAAGGALGIGLAALATPGGQTLLGRFTDPVEYRSWYYRIIIWENAMKRIVDHPVTGIGLSQGRFIHDVQGGEPSNNLLLQPMMEQGILGGVVLVVILGAAFKLAARVQPIGAPGNPRAVRIVLVAALVQLVLHGMGEPTFGGPAITFPFIYLLVWLGLNDSKRVPRA